MYSPNAATAEHHRDDAAEAEAAQDPDDRFDSRLFRRGSVRLPMAVEVDRQHHDDHAEKRHPCGEGDIEIDELRTIGGTKDVQRIAPFDCR